MRWISILFVAFIGCDSLRTPQTTETLQQLSFDPWKPVEKHFEDDHGLQTKQVELLETISGKLDTLNESKTTEMEAPPAENVELSELLKGLQESQTELLKAIQAISESVSFSANEPIQPVPDDEFQEVEQPSTPEPVSTEEPTTESEVEAEQATPFPVDNSTVGKWTRKHYFIRFYSGGDWCEACKTFKSRELPDLEKSDVRLELHDVDKQGWANVQRIPYFRIWRWNGSGWQLLDAGIASTADAILQRIDNDIEQQNNGKRNKRRPMVVPREPLASQVPAGPVSFTVESLRVMQIQDAPETVLSRLRQRSTIWVDRTADGTALQWTAGANGRDSVYRVGYNMAANKHLSRTGSPNNESPWLHSGGFDNTDVSIIAAYHVPGRIKLRRRQVELPAFRNKDVRLSTTKILGEYPVGTVAAEWVLNNETQQLCCFRYREKDQSGWCAGQVDIGPMPAGYLEVSDCTKCHEDITRHANEIDDQQEWYTTVRGIEKDGPFNFPLFVLTGSGMDGSGTINPAVEHLLDWVD